MAAAVPPDHVSTFQQAMTPFSANSCKSGTDKITRHGYGPMYAQLLHPLVGKPVSLLEIGVATGNSLRGWQAYLGQSAKVRGVDISLEKIAGSGLDVVQADATHPDFADTVPDSSLDVIIDDGSHRLEDQWTGFLNLWRKLKPGGVYIIEDIANEQAFKEMTGGVPFVFYDTRPGKSKDDLCAVFTRPEDDPVIRQPGAGVIIADCACSQTRGLGNHITLICAAYAAARVRGWETVVVWKPSQRADCEWSDLFQPLDGIEIIRDYPQSGIKQLACWYDNRTKAAHLETAGACRYTSLYWAAWKKAARMIRLIPELALPDYGKFDAISLRLASPPQPISDWWLDSIPDLSRPFISADCRWSFDLILKRFPDARFLSDVFQPRDNARRRLAHMQSSARDMMMLCRARRMITMGRESTFRNLAHIGYGVPVLKIYGGPAP